MEDPGSEQRPRGQQPGHGLTHTKLACFVLVYSSEMLVDDVWFRDNTVLGATNVGFGSWLHESRGGSIGGLYYTDNTVADSASSAWARTHLVAGRLHMKGNTGF